MNALFGVPMTTIALVLAGILAVCLLGVGLIAWRNPVMFKLGVRNIPRRPAQTALIVLGLMLSTLIIAAALGTGDTIDRSLSADVYRTLGTVDALVVASRSAEVGPGLTGGATFPEAAAAQLARRLAANPHVDGILPMLDARRPVRNGATSLAEPDVTLVGLDPAALGPFPLRTADGAPFDLAALPPDGVAISERLAAALDAKPGDRLTIFGSAIPAQVTVGAVVEDGWLTGVRRSPGSGVPGAGMVMPLARLQALTGDRGQLSGIALSATGGVRDSVPAANALADDLKTLLAGSPLGVNPIKPAQTAQAARVASAFTALFLLLGLFSIAAGVLLIVLIFTMLASERRSEMGMARAVGAQRSQLVQQFTAEGAGYALLSGLVGAALGVAAAWGIAKGMGRILGDAVPIDPTVSPRSLFVAYALGMAITFASVVVASWRISRLNVVAAIRDLPDTASPVRKRRTLLLGLMLLAVGLLLAVAGRRGNVEFVFTLGMSLLPFGVAALLRWRGAPARPTLTAAGLVLLLFWLLPQDVTRPIFGAFDGQIEMFFLAGIAMTVAATIVIVANLPGLLAGVDRLGGLLRGSVPALRVAIAYPGAAPARTGLTIAMFSLIVFSLVMTATMSRNFVDLFLGEGANAGWDVRAEAVGIDPLRDLPATLAEAGVPAGEVRGVGTTIVPGFPFTQVRVAGAGEGGWKNYVVAGMDPGFLDGTTFRFAQRATGYASDAAVVDALRRDPSLAVVDAFAVPRDDRFGPDFFRLTGVDPNDATFAPVRVEIAPPGGGTPQTVTVIGVIDRDLSSLFGLYTSDATVRALNPARGVTSYTIALADPAQAPAVAKRLESALLTRGVQATAIRDELAESQRQSTGFLSIIQGFMGLGLLVGLAAVGVIAFRSVVERRQQIGVLRAIGFSQGLVARSFLLEAALLVGVGVVAGATLGIILARNLFASGRLGVTTDRFAVPWGTVGLVLALSLLVALLMTWFPARQAARIAPAEALRYE